MTLQEYEAWLNQAPAGSIFIYHIGELARDRGRYGPKMEWIPHPTLDPLAARIYEDAERGLVNLSQQALQHPAGFTHLPRSFQYRAQRTSKEM